MSDESNSDNEVIFQSIPEDDRNSFIQEVHQIPVCEVHQKCSAFLYSASKESYYCKECLLDKLDLQKINKFRNSEWMEDITII